MQDAALFRAIMREDFASFARRALAEIMPGVDLKWNWHLDLIADRLTRLADGEIKRLLICVPPRSLKSLLCSVLFPAWLLARDATERILCLSYAQPLAEDFARQCRQLIDSPFYRATFDTRLSPERRAVEQFETTAGGTRIGNSLDGVVTGRGGDFIILDDPMKPQEALSEAVRVKVIDWLGNTLASRPNSKIDLRMLAIMQRLHEEDVAGHFLAQGGWETVILPAIAIDDETHHYEVAGQPVITKRAAGEVLHPEREPLEILEELRRTMSSLTFEAQYQQNPMPVEGNLVKRSWFKSFEPSLALPMERIIQSWDTGSKTQASHDYSACTTWGLQNGNIFLLDVWRGKLEMPELCRKVTDLSDRFRPERVLIEDKGAGTALLQALRAQYFHKGIPYNPKGDKLTRFGSITPTIEGGHVHLPHAASWLDDYLHELCGFPSTKHDDQVDSTSQALHWIREQGTLGGVYEYYRRLDEERRAHVEDRTVQLRAPHGVSHASTRDGMSLIVGPDRTTWVSEADAGPLIRAGFVRTN